MTLNTHPENRKEMVRAISKFVGLNYSYLYTPSCAYQIGAITVNRDGTITCFDETTVERIKPMLVDNGWLDQEPEEEADSEEQGSHMELTVPVRDWTICQLTNLARTLYGKQNLLNHMLESDMLYIAESFISGLKERTPQSNDDFEACVQRAIEEGDIRGVNLKGGKFTLCIPFCESDPTRWITYDKLLTGILKAAQSAVRVSATVLDDPENEKYHANSWLMRMGFGGPDYKPMRHRLMHHLKGYAAFKNAEDMQAHREKYARLRKENREAAQHEQTDR